MCTWITDIPQNTKQVAKPTKQNIALFLKPTEGNDVYRFRLLGFLSKKSERKTPYIQRFVHSVWVKNENGKSHTESVVCPVSPYVKDGHWVGNPMDDCPICKFSNQNYIAFKNSGFTDMEANKKNKDYGRKFEVLIPVYVITDPVHPENNGKLKVFGLYTKEDFEKFSELVRIERKEKGNQVFNGTNAVDFVIQLVTVKEDRVKKNGEKYVWTYNKVGRMGFLSNKAYDIPGITKEKIDAFEFDDQYWVYPTKEDLEEFYNAHVKGTMADASELPPMDDDVKAVFGSKPETPQPKVEKTNNIEKSTVVENKEAVKAAAEEVSTLPFDDGSDLPPMEPEKKKVEAPAKETKAKSDDVSMNELDDFLNTI